jgi:hypothetical protein
MDFSTAAVSDFAGHSIPSAVNKGLDDLPKRRDGASGLGHSRDLCD